MKNKIIAGMAFCLISLTNPASAQAMNNEQSLTEKERSIAAISAYTARGDMPNLKTALTAGLDAGLPVNDIKEVLVQMYAYCGFPRSLNALGNFMGIVKERESNGIKDAAGAQPGPLPQGSSLEFGTANQTKLTGAPVKGPLFDFAPAIDQFLKGHLFGDIFARDNIDWKTRELATIAALAAMDGTESQLNSHINVGKLNGLTDAQIQGILALSASAKNNDPFPKGSPAPANFSGEAHVAMLVNNKDFDVSSYNVTFAPGVRNNWHSHTVGQILLCSAGNGYYQERGKEARALKPGDVVEIPANTEHWHGAAPDSEFVHIGVTPKMSSNETAWGGPVTDEEYARATAPR